MYNEDYVNSQIKGKEVHHKKYGTGKIKAIQNGIIQVEFASETKRFIFPEAFETHLDSTDIELWDFLGGLFPDYSFNQKKLQVELKTNYPEFHVEQQILIKYLKNASFVTLPNGIEGIHRDAFADSTKTQILNLPSSVKSISTKRLHLHSLNEINVSANNLHFASFDGALYSKDFSKLILCPPGKRHIIFPDGVREICDYAFANCHYLTDITIPDTVSTLGDSLFDGLDEVDGSIHIPDSVKELSPYTFSSSIARGEFYMLGKTAFRNIYVPLHLYLLFSEDFNFCRSHINLEHRERFDTQFSNQKLHFSDRTIAILYAKEITELSVILGYSLDALSERISDAQCMRDIAYQLHQAGFHFKNCTCMNYSSLIEYLNDYIPQK